MLLDTHAWIWWAASRSSLSARARKAIEESRRLGVSAISCWEVAMLVRKGRLDLDREVGSWVARALSLPRIDLVELTPEIAVSAASLDDVPGDPADRIILASALAMKAPLVTKDEQLRACKLVKTIW